MPANDKRRAQRDKHDSVIEFFDSTGKLFAAGRLVDFSTLGVCFSTTRLMLPGERLNARVRLLNKGVIKIAAHVVWSRKEHNAYRYGVKFDINEKLP
jgi:hypothetical protein